MGERNVKNGQAWLGLSEDEKEVFNPQTFYALAGVPNPLISTDSDNQENHTLRDEEDGDTFVPVPQVHKLTLEEDQRYRPLYERLVNLQKVANALGKDENCESVTKVQRKSATAIEQFAHTVSSFFC